MAEQLGKGPPLGTEVRGHSSVRRDPSIQLELVVSGVLLPPLLSVVSGFFFSLLLCLSCDEINTRKNALPHSYYRPLCRHGEKLDIFTDISHKHFFFLLPHSLTTKKKTCFSIQMIYA
ncbi:hypothetical protein DL93DRAFT_1580039 [Clavulina sp. PMI_390]|nr:hypothetical protein DL93DRAFT_1580039 [Clavulina sp. PMI_390]